MMTTADSHQAMVTTTKKQMVKGSTLPLLFSKTKDMLKDTIEEVAEETVFKHPTWVFSGLKLENFCRSLLGRNKKNDIVKSCSLENISCLRGCMEETAYKMKDSEGRKQKGGKFISRTSSSNTFKNIFKSRSKSKEGLRGEAQVYKMHHTRQPFRAIPNEIQKLDKEPKRRGSNKGQHAYTWTVDANNEKQVSKHKTDSDRSLYKNDKSHSDVASRANSTDQTIRDNKLKGEPFVMLEESQKSAQVCSLLEVASLKAVSSGEKPKLLRKTVTTTTTSLIPHNKPDSEIQRYIDALITRPSRHHNNTLLPVQPAFSKQDYRDLKKRTRSVEVSIPRRQYCIRPSTSPTSINSTISPTSISSPISPTSINSADSGRKRACSVTRKTNLCTTITKVEEIFSCKKRSGDELVGVRHIDDSLVRVEDSSVHQNFMQAYKQTSLSQSCIQNQMSDILLSTTNQKTMISHAETSNKEPATKLSVSEESLSLDFHNYQPLHHPKVCIFI